VCLYRFSVGNGRRRFIVHDRSADLDRTQRWLVHWSGGGSPTANRTRRGEGTVLVNRETPDRPSRCHCTSTYSIRTSRTTSNKPAVVVAEPSEFVLLLIVVTGDRQIIVFVNEIVCADRIAGPLNLYNYSAASVHSKKQNYEDQILTDVNNKVIRILVATDGYSRLIGKIWTLYIIHSVSHLNSNTHVCTDTSGAYH